MFWALAMILLAVAVFSVGVARMPRRAGAPAWLLDPAELRGFLYVGAGALALLAIAVVVVGLIQGQGGGAEALAVLGFFAYAVYLGAAALIAGFSRSRR